MEMQKEGKLQCRKKADKNKLTDSDMKEEERE